VFVNLIRRNCLTTHRGIFPFHHEGIVLGEVGELPVTILPLKGVGMDESQFRVGRCQFPNHLGRRTPCRFKVNVRTVLIDVRPDGIPLGVPVGDTPVVPVVVAVLLNQTIRFSDHLRGESVLQMILKHLVGPVVCERGLTNLLLRHHGVVLGPDQQLLGRGKHLMEGDDLIEVAVHDLERGLAISMETVDGLLGAVDGESV